MISIASGRVWARLKIVRRALDQTSNCLPMTQCLQLVVLRRPAFDHSGVEYALNRLLGWRSGFGGSAFWAERLGRRVAGLGGHGLWRELAVRTDRLVG